MARHVTVTAAGNTTTYTYDRNGNLTGDSDGLGALEGRSYDRAGRLLTSDRCSRHSDHAHV